ncbi:hypothetical protein BGW80DRAFT_1565778 [Lactifluus volemus]|nr:hypothetical protein BGW80DRAFT_1565778 [Lactifluus volemus]
MTLPNTEIRVTPYGIPYVVEFANISVGPRPPVVHADVIYHISDLVPKPSLSRSNTLPATSTPKPLPSIPLPVQSKSRLLGVIASPSLVLLSDAAVTRPLAPRCRCNASSRCLPRAPTTESVCKHGPCWAQQQLVAIFTGHPFSFLSATSFSSNYSTISLFPITVPLQRSPSYLDNYPDVIASSPVTPASLPYLGQQRQAYHIPAPPASAHHLIRILNWC